MHRFLGWGVFLSYFRGGAGAKLVQTIHVVKSKSCDCLCDRRTNKRYRRWYVLFLSDISHFSHNEKGFSHNKPLTQQALYLMPYVYKYSNTW